MFYFWGNGLSCPIHFCRAYILSWSFHIDHFKSHTYFCAATLCKFLLFFSQIFMCPYLLNWFLDPINICYVDIVLKSLHIEIYISWSYRLPLYFFLQSISFVRYFQVSVKCQWRYFFFFFFFIIVWPDHMSITKLF